MNNLIPYSPSRYDSTDFLQKFLKKKLNKETKILDVGFGKLYFYHLLEDLRFRGKYLGIDVGTYDITKLKPNFDFKVLEKDILKFNSKDKFDLVVCLWVLEHIKKDIDSVIKISSLAKKDGLVIIAVPSTWTWPIEFGRHGYRYYSEDQISRMISSSGLEIEQTYGASGLLGLLFMFLYSWPRFLILIPAAIIFGILQTLKISKTPWSKFSKDIIYKTWYLYHRSDRAVNIHNEFVRSIVKLDNTHKLFPSSYIVIARKK